MEKEERTVVLKDPEDNAAVMSFIVGQIIEALQKKGELESYEVCAYQIHD